MKISIYKYTVNGLRLQANVASAVLTQIVLESTCRVPKVYIQCRLNVGCINTQCILCWGLNKETKKQTNKQTKKETKTLDEI